VEKTAYLYVNGVDVLDPSQTIDEVNNMVASINGLTFQVIRPRTWQGS